MICERKEMERRELNRRVLLAGIGIACLALISLSQGCDNAFSSEEKKEAAMIGSVSHVGPAIDLAAPSKTETATFSLG